AGPGHPVVRSANLSLEQVEQAAIGGSVELRLLFHGQAVRREYVRNRSVGLYDALVQPDAARAGRLDRGKVVADEDERRTAGEHLPHPLQALLLEGRVTDGKHLVDEQD